MYYEKETILFDINDTEKKFQLIQSIAKTRQELSKAMHNFDFAEDELIDFYTYQIKALQSKLDYLTRLAKKNEIELSPSSLKAV